MHHFQEYKQKYLLEERAQESVFSQGTSEDRVDYLNVEDYIFLSLKHYIKWILINFCFNTWSHCRLSCAFNFQGFCSLKTSAKSEEILAENLLRMQCLAEV